MSTHVGTHRTDSPVAAFLGNSNETRDCVCEIDKREIGKREIGRRHRAKANCGA